MLGAGASHFVFCFFGSLLLLPQSGNLRQKLVAGRHVSISWQSWKGTEASCLDMVSGWL